LDSKQTKPIGIDSIERTLIGESQLRIADALLRQWRRLLSSQWIEEKDTSGALIDPKRSGVERLNEPWEFGEFQRLRLSLSSHPTQKGGIEDVEEEKDALQGVNKGEGGQKGCAKSGKELNVCEAIPS